MMHGPLHGTNSSTRRFRTGRTAARTPTMGCGIVSDLSGVDHVLLCMLDAFAHRLGNFPAFAHAEPTAHAVSHDHKYAEAEPLSALDALLTLIMDTMRSSSRPAAIGFIVRCLLRRFSASS